MRSTGKRHAFRYDYDVGFDDDGRILGARPHARVALRLLGRPVRSGERPRRVPRRQRVLAARRRDSQLTAARRTPCPTPRFAASAGRRACSPIEHVIDDDRARARARSARRAQGQSLRHDGAQRHALRHDGRGQHRARRSSTALERRSRYRERRASIAQWNRANPVIKRGIALTPVKFGISFTATHYNQAGALLHVYHRRHGAAQSRRHRDGPGPVHQGRAGRRARARRAARAQCA